MARSAAPNRVDTVHQIEHQLVELRKLSESIGAEFLVYVLDMAITEASDIARGNPASPPEVEHSGQLSAKQLADMYMAGELD